MIEESKAQGPAAEKKPDRFQTVIAIAIAVVSIVSAAVIWRASMAESNASDADRRGVITRVQYEAAYAETVSMLYQEANYATQHASYQARVTALQAQGDTAALSEAERLGQVVVSLAGFSPMTTDPAYRTPAGGFDLDVRLADIRDADPDLRDLNPQQEFRAADRLYIEAQVLVFTVILFAVAIFFLTLAELTRHKIRLGLAAVGAVVFLISLSVVFVTELYFWLT